MPPQCISATRQPERVMRATSVEPGRGHRYPPRPVNPVGGLSEVTPVLWLPISRLPAALPGLTAADRLLRRCPVTWKVMVLISKISPVPLLTLASPDAGSLQALPRARRRWWKPVVLSGAAGVARRDGRGVCCLSSAMSNLCIMPRAQTRRYQPHTHYSRVIYGCRQTGKLARSAYCKEIAFLGTPGLMGIVPKTFSK